jgi:amino acid transporter
LAIVMVSFLACGASVVNYVSRIIYSMAREGNMPSALSQVAVDARRDRRFSLPCSRRESGSCWG